MFLYTWESVRFDKNAHCFAVEPSRLTLHFRCKHLRYAISSLCSFRLPPGTPKNNRNRGCFCLRGSPCVLIKTHTALQSNPPAVRNVPKAHIAPQAHRFCVQDSFVFSPRKNRPKYGRFFVVWIYCFLLKNALLILLFFVEQCFDCGN